MTARIYVACLSSYNNGRLYGRWIEASTDIEEMAAEIADMLRGSPYPNVTIPDYEAAARAAGWNDGDAAWSKIPNPENYWGKDGAVEAAGNVKAYIDAKELCEAEEIAPLMVPSAEEWAIHDYEGLGPNLGEYAGLEEVAKRVAIAEVAEDRDIPVSVLIEAMSDAGADDAEDFIGDNYLGEFDTWADMAEELETECGGLDEVPERFRSYIDFEAIGRDYRLSGDFSAYSESEHSRPLYFFWNHQAMKGRIEITKAEWARLGGLRNYSLFRVERNGCWHYYKAV